MRWTSLVFALVMLAGCRWTSKAAPWVAVSVVERAGGGCEWVKEEFPAKHRTVLATLPGPCDSAEAAWSVDRQSGLVATGALKPGAQANASGHDDLDSNAYAWTLYEVAFADHSVRALGTPPDGQLDDFGLDRAGKVRAMTFEPLPRNATVATYRGETFPVPDDADGTAALAHAWLWDGKTWSLDASRVLPIDPDGDLDGQFEWQSRLGPRTPNAYTEPDEDDPSWVGQPSLIARLDRAVGRTDSVAGSWRRVSAWPPLYNFVALGPGQTATLVRDDGKQAVVEDGLADWHGLARLEVRRGYLLSTEAHHVKLRLPDGKVALDEPAAFAAFWPGAPKGFTAGLTR